MVTPGSRLTRVSASRPESGCSPRATTMSFSPVIGSVSTARPSGWAASADRASRLSQNSPSGPVMPSPVEVDPVTWTAVRAAYDAQLAPPAPRPTDMVIGEVTTPLLGPTGLAHAKVPA